MSKEYFTDNLSIEAIAEITDEILKFEKNNKKTYLLKAISALAAAIVFVIGAINIIPAILINMNSVNSIGNGTDIAATDIFTGTENDTGLNLFTTDTTAEEDNSNNSTIQIGELLITTPKEHEPTDNGDGTATLPGGGAVTLSDGTKIIVPDETIVNIGGIDFEGNTVRSVINRFGNGNITVISPDGEAVDMNEYGIISINGLSLAEYVDEIIKGIRIHGLTIDEYISNEVTKAYNDEYKSGLEELRKFLEENFNWNDRNTQVGELIIQTPDGQEPIKNSDSTTTLPGGGTVIRSDGTKIILSIGAIIEAVNSDEIISRQEFITRIELPNGNIIEINGEEITINGENLDDVLDNMMNTYDISQEE